MAKKGKRIRTFDQGQTMTRAQKREAGLLVAHGHLGRISGAGTHDSRPRGERDRHNATRKAIAFERSLG